MEIKNPIISIITVNYGFDEYLIKTLDCFSKEEKLLIEHVVVVSGVTVTVAEYFECKYSSDNRVFIFNQDTSIYNAMNLGLQNAKGEFVLFLNGGDTLRDDNSLEIILAKLNSRKCHLFRTNQIWENDIYIRPSLKNLNQLLSHPAHQGFIAPLNKKTPRFNESRTIDADTIWMRECINLFGAEVHEEIIASFYLGGISNYPTFKSIKKRFISQGINRAALELIKLLIRKSLGNKQFYRLLAIKSGYDIISKKKL